MLENGESLSLRL